MAHGLCKLRGSAKVLVMAAPEHVLLALAQIFFLIG